MKKILHIFLQWILLLSLYSIGQDCYAANFYWRAVASDANLNNLANWELNASGSNIPATGAPGPGDNVFFTVSSNKETLTPTGEFNCNNMTFDSGLSYRINSATINIYGSLTGNGSVDLFYNTLQFSSTESSIIDLGTSSLKINGGNINFKGSGTYTLVGNDFLTTSGITFSNGSFVSNGRKITGGIINIPAATALRSIDFSNSTIEVTSFGAALMSNNDIKTDNTELVYTSGNIFRIEYGSISNQNIQFKSITFASTPASATINLNQNSIRNSQLIVDKLYLNNKSLTITNYAVGLTVSVNETLYLPQEYDIIANVPDVIFEINEINTLVSPCGAGKTFTNRSTGLFELKSLNSEITTNDIAYKGITFSGHGFKAPISNDLGQNSGIIEWLAALPSITYYWIGGTGNWHDPNHWSTSSNGSPSGCIPSGNDNVVFDAASFSADGESVTIDTNSGICNNITWTDPAKEGKLIGTKPLSVKSSADFSGCKEITTSIDYIGSGTITSGDVVYKSPTINFIQDGTYSLIDDFNASTTTTTININSGTFISNGKTVSANKVYSVSLPSTAVRTIDLSNSDVFATSQWYLWSDSAVTNFSNTHIQLTGNTTSFTTRGYSLRPVNYNKVSFTSATGIGSLDVYHYATGSNSPNYTYFDKLSFNSDANIYYSFKAKDIHLIKGKTYTFASNYNIHITGGIYTSGSECDLAIIKTITAGTRAILNKSAAPFIVEGVNIKDIAATAAVPLTIDGGVDAGNNLHVTVNEVTGRDMYWVGGTGNWSDASNHWSIGVSGGDPSVNNAFGCIPRSIDNVIFDNNSFPSTTDKVTLDIDGQCNNMTWTTEAGSKSPTFIGNAKKLIVDGSIELAPGTKFIDRFDITMNGAKTVPFTQYIHTHKVSLPFVYIYFVGTNRFELRDDLSNAYIEVVNANSVNAFFTTNGHTINTGYIRVTTLGVVDISGSTITCTNATSSYWNFANSNSGKKFKSDNSTIFSNGGMSIHVRLATDTAQFNNIIFTSNTNNNLSTDVNYIGRINIRKVQFKVNSIISHVDMKIDTLIYAKSSTNTISAKRLLIIGDTLIGNGTKCNPLIIQSSTTEQTTLRSDQCNIDIPFGMIRNVKADTEQGCTSEGYHVLANEAGVIQNSPGWSVTTLGALSLLGSDTTMYCSDFNYIQTTKESLGVGEKYEWFYNGQPYGGNTDTIHIKKPGTYSLKIEYAPGCFIDETATRRVFNLLDTIPPVVSCPEDKIVTVNKEGCVYKVNDSSFDATISDIGCDISLGIHNVWYKLSGATVADSISATTLYGVAFNKGITTVTWYAEDYPSPISNVDSCSFTVTVDSDLVLSTSGDVEICKGEITPLTASGADEYEWTPSIELSATSGGTVYASPAVTTTYTVVGTSVSGCQSSSTITVTVKPSPDTGTITGNNNLCEGETTLLSNSVAGGIWESSEPIIATINTNGEVTGLRAGETEIHYIVTGANGCIDTAKMVITVNALPDAGIITGDIEVCKDKILQLSNTVTGGTWESTEPSIATINVNGEVTGITEGTTDIHYTVVSASGCTSVAKLTITVHALPDTGTITGENKVCEGKTIQLSNSIEGGTWESVDTSIATIDANGKVTGVTAGTIEILYIVTNENGCTDTAKFSLTVDPRPTIGTISGNSNICEGETTLLSNSVEGGIWESLNTSIATVNANGEIRGVTAGNAEILYIVSNANGCTDTATIVVTVNALPDAGVISGNGDVCVGKTTSLNNSITGGTWESMDTSIATINANGEVTGIIVGTVDILYIITNENGCTSTAKLTMTVTPLPDAGSISGDTSVCEGETVQLSNSIADGIWRTTDAAIATVSSNGEVAGIAAGATEIQYIVTNENGCTDTTSITFTVNPLPDAGIISGSSSLCVGDIIQLSNTVAGGTWESTDTSIATIDTNGKVTGITEGITEVWYTVINTNGCSNISRMNITVHPLPDPGAIIGTIGSIELGQTVSLSVTGETGGIWDSSNPSVISVSSTGDITGVALGTSNITYTAISEEGCSNTTSLEVKVVDNFTLIVTPDGEICEGDSMTLVAEGAQSYVWSPADGLSSTTGASVKASPSVTTTYTVTGTNAFKTVKTAQVTVTVNPLPDSGTIIGLPGALQTGESIQMTSTGDTGGIWESRNPNVAFVYPNGIVVAIAPGNTEISYTVTNESGCSNSSKIAIRVIESKNPEPEPEPGPEPGPEPIPNEPKPGIKLESNQIICPGEQMVTIAVEKLYSGKLQYLIRFSPEAHTAGIQDINTYQDFPANGNISFSIPATVSPGGYKGIIVIKGEKDSNLVTDYLFEFEVLAGVTITRQPVSAGSSCDNDTFTLSVEATGTDLIYQWYFNDAAIPGANESTYQGRFSMNMEGEYYVKVMNTCESVISNKVAVSANTLEILVKWDDVLYIPNTDNRYTAFQWYKDGEAIEPYGTSVFYTDEKSGLKGTYKIRAYKADGTYEESCPKYFESSSRSALVSVYPNPVLRNTSVMIRLAENENTSIEIYDLAGRRIYNGQLQGVIKEIPMDVPTGTYLVKITLESGKVVTRKLIVK